MILSRNAWYARIPVNLSAQRTGKILNCLLQGKLDTTIGKGGWKGRYWQNSRPESVVKHYQLLSRGIFVWWSQIKAKSSFLCNIIRFHNLNEYICQKVTQEWWVVGWITNIEMRQLRRANGKLTCIESNIKIWHNAVYRLISTTQIARLVTLLYHGFL